MDVGLRITSLLKDFFFFNGTLSIYNDINKVVVSEGEELGSNLEKLLGQTPCGNYCYYTFSDRRQERLATQIVKYGLGLKDSRKQR